MPHLPHFDIPGSLYFVTSRIEKNVEGFSVHDMLIIQNAIIGMTHENLSGRPWSPDSCNGPIAFESEDAKIPLAVLYAHVVMPNHIHVLMKPLHASLSRIMQLLKGRSSHSMKRGKVWQAGFYDFVILKEKTFREKVNYIHENPVKWGLVERAEDWKFSSAGEYMKTYGGVYYID